MDEHKETAHEVLEDLRALKQKIPNLVVPVTKGERRKLAPAAAVPADFVERMAVAVETDSRLVRGGGLTPQETRTMMSYVESFGPLADEMEALVGLIRHSITAARHKVAVEALITYSLARRLAERPEHADLIPHVADMRRALGPRGRRKTKSEPEPETEPQSGG